MKHLALVLATTGFLGNRLPAPGTTAGSLPAIILYWFLVPSSMVYGPGAVAGAAFVAVFCLFSVWVSTVAEGTYGHDANAIVIDEVAGMWVALLFLPKGWIIVAIAFVAFRFFDIVKPFPSNRAQNLRGGWGVVADDVVAGIYANLVAQVAVRILPGV